MSCSSIPRAIDSSCYISALFLWSRWPQKSLCVSLSKWSLLACSSRWLLLACLSHNHDFIFSTFTLFFPPSKWFLFPISLSTFISITSCTSYSLSPVSMTITQCCVCSAMLISFKINTNFGQTSFSVLLIPNTFFHTNNYILSSATHYLLL